ncbi:alpha-glucuronidase family glycosyl hydrolase [Paenibacillus hexagrammi]|uniref:Uncharacterized protein n=1 Tax=Paenibacillus hexagrammi TaxID=2908839 RepID=A0ABY3SRA1_9BACL|nr:alpha-glucuronidase family glycosyl hydrolase [Paenibacillus sp. YPD9-1]UJF36407.1 hypothetical protein L0M14_18440 [Paenibacillus sp. YPD9-1]
MKRAGIVLLIISFILMSFVIPDKTARAATLPDENGYDLWLRYPSVTVAALLAKYRQKVTEYVVEGSTDISGSIRKELNRGLSGLLGQPLTESASITQDGAIVVGALQNSPLISSLGWDEELQTLGHDGFMIRSATLSGHAVTVIASASDQGALYGTYQLLSRIQRYQSIDNLNISDKPAHEFRMLNHWDNWSGSIERGYAGSSIWNWSELPETVSPRYEDYARANASIGINGAVLNNVNASYDFIDSKNLPKIAAIADVLRKYGIRVYLSIRFDSPILSGALSTADPMDPQVIQWWHSKIDEIYSYIPDFGGFSVKGDSEGQPGPLKYGRTHAQGANMLADILQEHNGMVIWRAFVYGVSGLSSDRTKQAYEVFKPLDGQFADNVILQAKEGPLDFQIREPLIPVIGGMPNTNTGLELQITQEYTGQSTDLCWLIPMWKEVFNFDTKALGAGSTVEKVINGSLFNHKHSMVAGVSNIGASTNWTGQPLGQANWYGYGRLA